MHKNITISKVYTRDDIRVQIKLSIRKQYWNDSSQIRILTSKSDEHVKSWD